MSGVGSRYWHSGSPASSQVSYSSKISDCKMVQVSVEGVYFSLILVVDKLDLGRRCDIGGHRSHTITAYAKILMVRMHQQDIIISEIYSRSNTGITIRCTHD